MKNLFLFFLKIIFKIDVKKNLRHNKKFNTKNQKLSKKLCNSIENQNIDLNKKSKDISVRKELTEKHFNQKKAIEELNKTIEDNIKIDQNNNKELNSLKELINSYQTDSKKTIDKDILINRIIDNINNVTDKNNYLLHEFKNYKDKTKKIQHSKDYKSVHKLPDSSLVEHENIILGERTIRNQEREKNRFEYIGEFLFDLHVYFQNDHPKFPAAFYPKKRTNILKWHNSSLTETKGISEPKLFKGLQQLHKICPEIEIIQNIILSIKNREYGYHPDIALIWKKYNLYFDIEIDEPYDILSRKPIHYIDSSDYLRNIYFTRQGWVVLRFSEEQVIKSTDDCIKYVASILKKITHVNIFDSLLEGFQIVESNRWTYNQSLEFAQNNYRENYLEIEISESTILPAISNSEFKGIAPGVDILPEIDFSVLKQKFENSKQKKYIRITRLPYEIQYIFQNSAIETQNFAEGISGFDLVTEKKNFIPFEVVIEIEGLDSPFKNHLYHNNLDNEDKKLYDFVKEAIYACNPIRIEYRDAKADITFRNLKYISYSGDSFKYLCDRMWQNYYSTKSSMIEAYCMLRNDSRTFYISRIQSIQIFNLNDFCFGHLMTFADALWYSLENDDLKLSEHIVNLLPNHEKDNNLFTACNLAHYLLVSGEKEKALDIYRKFDGRFVSENLTWKDMNLQDFETLKDISDYGKKFENAICLLGWK